MDRIMLDLNLPPPACWSPQAGGIPSTATDACQVEGDGTIPIPKDCSDVNLLLRETGQEHSTPREDDAKERSLDNEDPNGDCSPRREYGISEVKMEGAETVVGDKKKVGGHEIVESEISDVGVTDGHSRSPRRVEGCGDVKLDCIVQSDCRIENDSNPKEELTTDPGVPVKVHKRLRTLGQLQNKKEQRNAVDTSLEDQLEDECASDTGGKDGLAQGDGLTAGRIRITSQVRSKRREKSTLADNSEDLDTKESTNSFRASKVNGVCGTSARGESGRFLPKIPSQPRSKKPERRTSFTLPTVASTAVDSEDSKKGEQNIDNGNPVAVNNERSSKVFANSEKLEESSAAQSSAQDNVAIAGSETGPVALSNLKRPGQSIKDAMPGKKRRQTVLLEVDESLKQARPLRTPTGKEHMVVFPVIGERVPDFPPPHVDKQENMSSDASVSAGLTETTGNLDMMVCEDVQESMTAKPLTGDGTGIFRRPGLKRQPTSNARDDNGWKSRDSSTPRVSDPDIKRSVSNIESSLSQKTRKMLRKTETNNSTANVQDASIERLHREATCSKLWRTSGPSGLQKVPGRFDSVEEYVRVLEPLLFEECRAQLRSSWDELQDASDAHVPVIIKSVERRERGWYDVTVLPEDPAKFRFKDGEHKPKYRDVDSKLHFKEGDVAVISTPMPGTGGRQKGRTKASSFKEKEDGVFMCRLTGIVRRYNPIDVRDPPGAVVHFHVSSEDLEDTSGVDPWMVNGNVLKELNRAGVSWFLTVLGSVTTTQREYVALHYLQQFHPKMLSAILQPRPELFPGYADQEPPAMPECFTPAFVEHLHGNFNGPQLAAIQWAGAHTAAGSVNSATIGTPKQEPWPFTLVQGPPGTGKTHTVWGMLNVIHLVQYQRYYQALLKKLAPSSVASEEPSSSNQGTFENGSIDDVLKRMDDSLARMLPKLCPKPRMLVCAPSNAATDELLSRVLDRGFIDGEMKQYRPDVARVGSDPMSRAAQAVSVERRSTQLLSMGREEVVKWLQQLKQNETNCSQIIAVLQRDLNEAAVSARSQGNLGVDPEKLAARDHARDTKLQMLAARVEERDKILVEMSRLLIVEGRFRHGAGFSQDDARHKLEASFANEAEIVFTTVSSSGRRIFTKLAHGFDMVVIDEAAQASEVAVLPPLSLRAARCVLVGDPQQLPATVISRVADTMQYSRSLFERFQQAGCPAILLSIQYRMHPQIREFPSQYFYQGRLLDSESVKNRPDESYHNDSLLQPYLFYDISHGRESHGGSVSYQNKLEAQVAVQLYVHLQEVVAAGDMPGVSVGMITPYKQQLRCLQQEFQLIVGVKPEDKGVYINTVDAFQGQERDVIMMSCVRASTNGVGFVADIRRMNVALTRARRALWVIGNASALLQSEDWAALIADAKSRGCFVETAVSLSKGLLTEPTGPLTSSGMLRHTGSSHLLGNSSNSFGRGRHEDESSQPGNESDQRGTWHITGHRGGRTHRDSLRGSFNQRGLSSGRTYGRGMNSSYRRGKYI